MNVEPALKIADFHVFYGQVEAVHGVNLEILPRSIISLIGPNGAGKSSTLNAVLGLARSTGRITLNGAAITSLSTEERVARGLVLVPEKRELFSRMTVRDNLLLGSFRRSKNSRQTSQLLDEVYYMFPRLRDRERQLAGTLSGGERQMLAIGRALMAAPEVLLLDEPSLGLAPLIVREILQTVVDLRERGLSVLLVEQNVKLALQISEYGYVLELGRIALEGNAESLVSDPRVAGIYLGDAFSQAIG